LGTPGRWRESTPEPQAAVPEFQEEAARPARQTGLPIHGVTQDLRIAGESLRRWVIQTNIDRGDAHALTKTARPVRFDGSRCPYR
jgi:hypothetical protein